MSQFLYTDSRGVERVVRADSLKQAERSVWQVEHGRSGSVAAANIAARSVRPRASRIAGSPPNREELR